MLSLLHYTGPFIFIGAGFVLMVLMQRRTDRLQQRERTAIITAVFGLFLCGRYALKIDPSHGMLQVVGDWIWVTCIAVLMVSLAHSSLGFAKRAKKPAQQ